MRAYCYRVRMLQRAYRRHRRAVHAQLELLVRQVRRLEWQLQFPPLEMRGDSGLEPQAEPRTAQAETIGAEAAQAEALDMESGDLEAENNATLDQVGSGEEGVAEGEGAFGADAGTDEASGLGLATIREDTCLEEGPEEAHLPDGARSLSEETLLETALRHIHHRLRRHTRMESFYHRCCHAYNEVQTLIHVLTNGARAAGLDAPSGPNHGPAISLVDGGGVVLNVDLSTKSAKTTALMSKPSPTWPTRAVQVADWPRLAEARGSRVA